MTKQVALDGVNVLDLSDSIGGAYCTKLLADLGANVLLVERPESGHPLRYAGPFKDEAHPEKSGLFLHYAANKRSLACDLRFEEGRNRFRQLATDADVLVESSELGRLNAQGLGYEALRELKPSLVYASVTHFGQTGPYRNWKSDEIVDFAMGGYMYFMGHRDREPLMLNNNQPMLNAGAQAAIAVLAALWWRRKTGEGQHIDVSSVEAMLSAHSWTSALWTHEGVVMRRSEPDCIPCKDGWVWFFSYVWDLTYFILIEQPELMEDPRFTDRQGWTDNRKEFLELLRAWCADKTMDEIVRSGQELRIAVTPVNDPKALLDSRQLQAREWFQNLDHPVAGEHLLSGFPYSFRRTPASIRRPAPLLGEHSDFEFTRRQRSFDPAERRPLIEAGDRLPLSGVRVLELTANWAGPLAARHLADLGAEVIKIEPPDRPATRGGQYPGAEPLKYHYNRSAYFNKLNRNKLDVALNLSHPEGRELLLELVRESDVVLENYSPRVFRNFDLQYPVLREINPDLIMVSISGFGQTGPDLDYAAYGANVEASCGLAASTGYADDDRPYRTTLFYADPVTGAHAAVAILAALHHRSATGEGQYIDISLHESGTCFFPESLLEYTVAGRDVVRRGNRHQRHAPQGCYPSFGNDAWMVLCVRTEEEWRGLTEVIGRTDLWIDGGLRSPQGRMARHDEIDAAISEWSSQFDHNEATRLLQAAGVPAGPVLANWELTSNPHFFHRGFYIPIEHPEMGVLPNPGMPWILSQTPGQVRMASPLFAEHNRLVFQGLLGKSDEELAPLFEHRTIADAPPEDHPYPMRPRR